MALEVSWGEREVAVVVRVTITMNRELTERGKEESEEERLLLRLLLEAAARSVLVLGAAADVIDELCKVVKCGQID